MFEGTDKEFVKKRTDIYIFFNYLAARVMSRGAKGKQTS